MSEPQGASWRVIDSGPGEAAWNMAVDEALLECWREGDAPILRLYRWCPAAISLGRFQPSADVTPPDGVSCVRRLSGGSAIFHREDEVTYAVVAPYAVFGSRRPRVAYHAVHDVIRVALDQLGVPRPGDLARASASTRGLCFDTPTDYDLVAGAKKLVGSAQRRRGRAFLQHGSLPMSPDPLAQGATSLSELLDRFLSPEQVSAAIVSSLAGSSLALRVKRDRLRAEEERAAGALAARYSDDAWTHQR